MLGLGSAQSDRVTYYVIPHIGSRTVQEVDGKVCDALCARLPAEGQVKAKPRPRSGAQPVHAHGLSATERVLPCRPYRYDSVRCYRAHPADDPLIGQPIVAVGG